MIIILTPPAELVCVCCYCSCYTGKSSESLNKSEIQVLATVLLYFSDCIYLESVDDSWLQKEVRQYGNDGWQWESNTISNSTCLHLKYTAKYRSRYCSTLNANFHFNKKQKKKPPNVAMAEKPSKTSTRCFLFSGTKKEVEAPGSTPWQKKFCTVNVPQGFLFVCLHSSHPIVFLQLRSKSSSALNHFNHSNQKVMDVLLFLFPSKVFQPSDICWAVLLYFYVTHSNWLCV